MNTQDKEKIYNLVRTVLDTSLSTTARGTALEDIAEMTLTNAGSSNIKRKKRSGALHGDGDMSADLNGTNIVFDCKVNGKCLNINIPFTDLDKISRQAAITNSVGAIVSLINRNNHIQLYATIKLTDLLEITSGV